MSAVAGLVLAAGRGTRFGPEPKLLARLHGAPLVRHVGLAALAAGLDPVVAVTGHLAGPVAAALDGLAVRIVHNPAHAEGLSTSLTRGLDALTDAEAVIVLLGDMPGVRPATIRALAAAHAGGQAAAIVPTHAGRRGNPVLLDRRLFPDLRRLRGDAGAGRLLRDRVDVVELAVPDPAILADIDTQVALDLWTSATCDPGGPPPSRAE